MKCKNYDCGANLWNFTHHVRMDDVPPEAGCRCEVSPTCPRISGLETELDFERDRIALWRSRCDDQRARAEKAEAELAEVRAERDAALAALKPFAMVGIGYDLDAQDDDNQVEVRLPPAWKKTVVPTAIVHISDIRAARAALAQGEPRAIPGMASEEECFWDCYGSAIETALERDKCSCSDLFGQCGRCASLHAVRSAREADGPEPLRSPRRRGSRHGRL